MTGATEQELEDSGLIRCWCGAVGTYDEMFLDSGSDRCGGLGERDCHCGGDLCVCHNHGTIECYGCEDCEGYDDEWCPEYED